MKVYVAKNTGFCAGVRHAVDAAFSLPPENVYVLGELIHNEEIIGKLSERGIVTVQSAEEGPQGATLLIRSHGAPRTVFEQCALRGVNVVDCTCSFVHRTQKIVAAAGEAGKSVVIVGYREHPEVVGLVGWCKGEVFVFASEEDDFSVLSGKNLVLVSQTTFSEQRFLKIAENIKKVAPKTVETFKTICYTTVDRQREAARLSETCEAVIVIGGAHSSNTAKLCEIASAHGSQVIHLQSADDFEYEKIKFFRRVGIIAGASTPDWQTQEVLFKMAENNAEVLETASLAEDTVQMAKIVDDLDKNERYKKGQIITANIVSATDEGIYVSASGKLEILLSKEELDCEEYSREAYAARVGEEIRIMVIEVSPKVKLSEKAVKKIKEEEELLKEIEAGKEFTVTCTGFNKGGLTAQLGSYPVFVPAREIRSGYVKELDKYQGKTLRLRLLEIRKERRKEIIASQRVILEEERAAKEAAKAEKEAAFFDAIQVGDVVEGKVERATAFGAFVSVNGFDCLAHISDLSWSGVKAVTDVLEIGKRYEFQVLKVDRENKKVSIGYKQLQPQPWDLAAEKYAEGDIVHGKVVRIVPFGAFVELEKGIDGLVHVSQISHEWLENPTSVLKIGEEIDAKIIAFSPADKKITLSIKALAPRPEYEPRPAREEGGNNGQRRQRKNNRRGGNGEGYEEEEEYREWKEGSGFGASISELLGTEEDK